MDDFRKYATKHLGMNSLVLDDVIKSQAGYLNPYILEERQLNVTQLDVFSRLMMDRIIFLGTQVDDYTANTLQAQLLYLDSVDPGKDISIYINSPGGSVYAGLGIYDTMQFISSDVATICTGMAASMAAVLLVAGAEGKRSALTHSRVMIHQPMGGAQGQASDIEITAREIQKLKKELYTIIADHSHTPFDKVWADSDRDYWMTAQEAKDVYKRQVGYSAVRNTAAIDKSNMMQYIAPQDLKSFGLIPEIIGRLPVLTYLNPLDRVALRSILTEPKNSIIKQYIKLFEMDNVKLTFEDAVFEYIVDKAVEYKLGARGLRSIVETIMMDAMFEIPSEQKENFVVTLDYAKHQLEKANMARLQST